jgi:chromosome segregation protein
MKKIRGADMYLEDMAIKGFKSFSENTNMSFQPGISVIIGNNGVGKSNILDAIVWALGETDLNRVRCYSPDELFFAGSKDYPPAQRIKVDLTFRQSTEKNAPEIRLGRILQRNGVDQCHIMDQTFSLNDYRKKLSEFNLVHSLKTIIRQEQINDMLLLNPESRFDRICALLELKSCHDFFGELENHIADSFR